MFKVRLLNTIKPKTRPGFLDFYVKGGMNIEVIFSEEFIFVITF